MKYLCNALEKCDILDNNGVFLGGIIMFATRGPCTNDLKELNLITVHIDFLAR